MRPITKPPTIPVSSLPYSAVKNDIKETQTNKKIVEGSTNILSKIKSLALDNKNGV